MIEELNEKLLEGINGGTTVDEKPAEGKDKKKSDDSGDFKKEAVKFVKKVAEEAYGFAKEEVGKDYELHDAAPKMHLGKMSFNF